METYCPLCENACSECWTKGRMLRLECSNPSCGWAGDPYQPPKIEVKALKTIDVNHGSFHFELFDRHGHVAVFSRGYPDFDQCKTAAEKELVMHNRIEGYGPCSVVIWPATITVKGELLLSN